MVVPNASNAAVVAAALQERLRASMPRSMMRRCARRSSRSRVRARRRFCSRSSTVDLKTIKYYSGTQTTACGVPAILARTGYTGEDGFELFVAWDDAVRVWDTLLEAGAARGLVPAGLGARDTLRLEAGMPLYGQRARSQHHAVRGGARPTGELREER